MKTLTLAALALSLAACAPAGSPQVLKSDLASGDLMLRPAFLTAASSITRGPYSGGIESWKPDRGGSNAHRNQREINGGAYSEGGINNGYGWSDRGKYDRLGSD